MKVICAPDSFKESLSATAAAAAMARGVKRAVPDAVVDLCPISDGGEGFTDAMLTALPGRARCMVTEVRGPLGRKRPARWGFVEAEDGKRTAIIEMAAASGLELVPPEQRDPIRTTTYGTGQLIRAAIVDEQCDAVLIGIGGSATCDGGCGAAQALAVSFFDRRDKLITQPITGGMLGDITRIDLLPQSEAHPQLHRTDIAAACDVTNPLTGPNGAARVYGPQKGATPEQVEQLDAGLRHLAQLARDQLNVDHEHTPGAGAAGGLGFGLMTFLGATLRRGIDLVLDAVRFDERVRDADLVLTGEGRIDGQSLAGKACLGVAKAAGKHGVPTIALVGAAAPDADRTLDAGLQAYHVIGEGLPVEESMRRAAELLEQATERVVRESMRNMRNEPRP